jgi:hypothetical protein
VHLLTGQPVIQPDAKQLAYFSPAFMGRAGYLYVVF